MSKLREKFEELAFAKIPSEELRDESVKITEDFAIKFAEWLDTEINGVQYQKWQTRKTSTEELVQIFKENYYG